MTQRTFFKPSETIKRTRELPDPAKIEDKEVKRIVSAMEWIKEPFHFQLESLNEKILAKISSVTNSAFIQFSMNCTLLAMLLLYNLKISRTELAGTNTWPIYEAINLEQATDVILGKPLIAIKSGLWKTSQIESEILSYFKQSGERLFLIGMDYIIFRKTKTGHMLNAVVIHENEQARVLFVDAQTSNHITSAESLEKTFATIRYAATIYVSPPSFEFLKNPLLQQEIKKDTLTREQKLR